MPCPKLRRSERQDALPLSDAVRITKNGPLVGAALWDCSNKSWIGIRGGIRERPKSRLYACKGLICTCP
jgi:hypothetical protein